MLSEVLSSSLYGLFLGPHNLITQADLKATFRGAWVILIYVGKLAMLILSRDQDIVAPSLWLVSPWLLPTHDAVLMHGKALF